MIDIGEQFHNLILHENTQEYAGIDLTAYFPEELQPSVTSKQKRTIWERWTRCGMGFRPSPYQAVQGTLHAEEQIRGDPLDPANPFHFDAVVLNLPGKEDYNPTKPWVFKFCSTASRIAGDIFIYVDDVRTTGASERDTWLCARKAASTLNYLGLQDAARKRRGPTLEPGAWAGSIVLSNDGLVRVTVAVERWVKAKAMVQWIAQCVQSSMPLHFKTLESYWGSGLHLSYLSCIGAIP
jgi:hypothetical protein